MDIEIVLKLWQWPLRNPCPNKAKGSAHNQCHKGIFFKVVTVITSAVTTETGSKHIQKRVNEFSQVKNSKQNSTKETVWHYKPICTQKG